MGTLAALVLATPIFGLSLELDPTLTSAPLGAAPMAAVASAVGGADGGDADDVDDDDAPAGQTDIAAAMQQRGRIAPIHKWMGVATWTAMAATVFLGWIQWYNLYGFFADQNSNPCVEGNAVFGQGQCWGTPVPHLTSALLTTALYSVTFGLSFRMPDPMGLDEGDGDYAKNLRRHKRLRWVHLAGMIAQMGLGLVVANADRLGLDRANDYGTLQALSTIHMGIGLVTFAALTWAGAIFLF